MAVIYFTLLLGLHSQKLITFMDSFHTELYTNLMEKPKIGQNSIHTLT